MSLSRTFLLFVFVLLFAGCSGSNKGKSMIADANDSNVKRLATMYSFFHTLNNNKGPVDKAEFKKFIQSQDERRLALADIDPSDIDSLFVSERDKQPFVIRYGIDTYVRGPSLPVIFEETGIEGMRDVGFFNGNMKTVDKAEYDQLLAGESDGEKMDDGRPD